MNTITTSEPLTNQVILRNGKRIERYNIATTPHWVYTVFEADDREEKAPELNHGTIKFEGGLCWGRMATRELPVDINAIPADKQNLPKRLDAISVWRHNLDREIEKLIWSAFPETNLMQAQAGEICVTERRTK